MCMEDIFFFQISDVSHPETTFVYVTGEVVLDLGFCFILHGLPRCVPEFYSINLWALSSVSLFLIPGLGLLLTKPSQN